MGQAATIDPVRMSEIFLSIPQYHYYFHHGAAVEDESAFRQALGQMLNEMGQRLLSAADGHGQGYSTEQQEMLEDLCAEIGEILKHLNRRGAIALRGRVSRTIPELRLLDNQLIMVLEQGWHAVRKLLDRESDLESFMTEARDLATYLETFTEIAEERNHRLGLGWESEFKRGPISHDRND